MKIQWRCLAATLKAATPFWIFLGGTVSALLIARVTTADVERVVNRAGTVLQLEAVVVAGLALHQLAQMFGQPSLLRVVDAWFGRLLACFSRPRVFSGAGTATLTLGGSAEGSAIRALPTQLPLEAQIAFLKEEIDQLRREMDARHGRISQELAAVRQVVEQERQARVTADQDIARKLQEMGVGGQHLEWVALGWVLLGSLATNIPQEMAWFGERVAQMF